jgi:hypothetical protein
MSSILRGTAAALCVILCVVPTLHGAILSVEFDTGNLYSVDTTNASLTLITETGVPMLGSLEYHDGSLYAMRVGGSEAALYQFGTDGSAVSKVGSGLGTGYYYEGGLAFAPDGTAYATNRGSSISPELITVNTFTGIATVVGIMSDGSHDINGMVWRSDGMLVGVDRLSNAIVEINPFTAEVDLLAKLEGALVGGVGGMVLDGNIAYLATAGPDSTRVGSNSLYSVNLNTGAVSSIGVFNIGGTPLIGSGISGLSVVPEPSALAMLTIATLGFVHRRRAA